MAAKWSDISENESLIYLSLNIKKKYSGTGWNDRYSVRSYRVVTVDSLPSHARAEIYYYDTAPNVFFPSIQGPKDRIKGFNFFRAL
jgi:hypothetical protein